MEDLGKTLPVPPPSPWLPLWKPLLAMAVCLILNGIEDVGLSLLSTIQGPEALIRWAVWVQFVDAIIWVGAWMAWRSLQAIPAEPGAAWRRIWSVMGILFVWMSLAMAPKLPIGWAIEDFVTQPWGTVGISHMISDMVSALSSSWIVALFIATQSFQAPIVTLTMACFLLWYPRAGRHPLGFMASTFGILLLGQILIRIAQGVERSVARLPNAIQSYIPDGSLSMALLFYAGSHLAIALPILLLLGFLCRAAIRKRHERAQDAALTPTRPEALD